MTENPANRLWPLALMGWLAAFPPLTAKAATAQPIDATQQQARSTAITTPSTLGKAPLSAAERAAIRRRRRREGV